MVLTRLAVLAIVALAACASDADDPDGTRRACRKLFPNPRTDARDYDSCIKERLDS